MNDIERYMLDVDDSIAKRMQPKLDDIVENCHYMPDDKVQPWVIYRQVEMMDKHIESFGMKSKGPY